MCRWYITSVKIMMRNFFYVFISLFCVSFISSCCVLFPNARTSTVSVSVSPSNATISSSSGRLYGTGSCQLDFDCRDSKGAYYTIVISAPDYKTKTEKIYNYRSDYSRSYSLRRLEHSKVNFSVIIYLLNCSFKLTINLDRKLYFIINSQVFLTFRTNNNFLFHIVKHCATKRTNMFFTPVFFNHIDLSILKVNHLKNISHI